MDVYAIENNLENVGEVNKVENETSERVTEIGIYKRRWLMLAAVAILNLSNGAIWITFAPIAIFSSTFFSVDTSLINWFSLVTFVVAIPLMFVAMWVTDRFGFKLCVLIGALLNGVGSLVRLLGTVPIITKDVQYPLAIAGQTISSAAQPFVMCLPTKVSDVWFPENQRTISTAIAAMAYPFGSMMASIISPSVVSVPSDVPIANYIISGFGIAAGIFGLVVRESKPPKPPSVSAAKSELIHLDNSHSYLKHLKKILLNKHFVILSLTIGAQMGIVSALQTMMAQMLCPWGYDDDVAGLCCATMIIGGFIGAAVFSVIAEKTKRFEEIIKCGYCVAVIFCIAFIVVIINKTKYIAIHDQVAKFKFIAIGF
ncbi:hypothetical protein CHUAL_006192 [Chamberlinius hualienensis]